MNLTPSMNGTFAFTANGVASNANLPLGGGLVWRIQNAGPQIVFCAFTSDANRPAGIPTANVGGGFPVFANQPALHVQAPVGATNVTLISAGNSTVYFTRGDVI